MQDRSKTWLSLGVVGAVGASLCCTLPLLLVMAGLGGAWLGTLQLFAPFRPAFILFAFAALAVAGWQIFRTAPACEAEQVCVEPALQRRRKGIFLGVTALVVALIASPYLVAYLG
ncbi:MAG: mercuric transporter MerT family protein [Nevskiales bacterium]